KAKGLLDDQGLGLAFGDGPSVLRAIEAIALRKGVGSLLAEGSLRAAKTLGQAAVDLTVTVKGQELPAHMPQHKRSLGLIYAVNAFGADHQSSEHDSMLRAKPGSLQRRRLAEIGDFGDLDLRDLSDDKVRFAYTTQCFYSALDTLGLCQFVWGPSWQLYGPAETVELVRSGTGWDASMSELMRVGERRINLLRAFNAREGIGKAADTPPKKLFEPLAGKGPTAGVALTTEEFEHARATYYQIAGCDPATGYPTRAKLADLDLEWLVDTVPARSRSPLPPRPRGRHESPALPDRDARGTPRYRGMRLRLDGGRHGSGERHPRSHQGDQDPQPWLSRLLRALLLRGHGPEAHRLLRGTLPARGRRSEA